ncbi:MAG: biopolymer transporter ExbD [Verrucomicrobia bacterium]|nr:biopolymer transporter ExbD [Verrucomicrobiota bacterium]MCH8511699.1 biopolymer transporter ExbD [Kiritimatiellia bacterium]
MKRRGYNLQEERPVDINLSPLIDVVFLLLIFFLVTAVFVQETGIDIETPRALSARDADRLSLQIALTEDGRIVSAGRDIPMNSVRALVQQRMRARPVPVLIQADANARTGLLVELYDECKRGGAEQVLISASREAGR